ncbi:hypothetical protein R3W88_013446 [Solanum pinnatisectum]|uniref:Uncharacterized protein n=1 Tax=Solanum pinnatisectum TaxID=50273 RepID=A0AAV9LCI7_9SOLN|nr:hypothetical protein R3W88_013446 [Solanum pinnatisectum]
MGACLSSSSTIVDQKQLTSYVISINGELHQYSVPINVSQVLQSDISSDAASSFLCSSDRLYFDDFIPSLDSQYQLLPGQIYFMLPASKLKYRLSASDMAALAVKASAALEDLNNNKNKNKSRKSRKIMSKKRISPMLLQVEEDDYTQTNNKSTVGLGISMRSASVRKLQRLSSRRAKMAVRSFRKLITIQEGFVLF